MCQSASEEIKVFVPREVNDSEISLIVNFCHKYGHIPNVNYLKRGISNAEALVLCRDKDLVGVAVIKLPTANHVQGVFRDAGSKLDLSKYELELGYIAVHPDRQDRGIGKRLMRCALDVIGKRLVFATARENNFKIHKMLERTEYAFVREGKAFPSEEGNYKLLLFVRNLIRI